MKKVHGNSLKSGKWNPSQRTQFKSVEVATQRDSSGKLVNYVQPGQHGNDNTRAVKVGKQVDFTCPAGDFNLCYEALTMSLLSERPMSDIDRLSKVFNRTLANHNLEVRNGDQFLL